jgi:two-component system, NtrC family, nitrogen regulation sensor histidine kinase NtrY
MPTDHDAQRATQPASLAELERRRRRRDLALVLGALAALAAVVAVERRIAGLPDSVPFADSLPFLALNAVSVVLIVLLVYLSGRQLVKLWFERRAGIFGAHLNAKFVLALFLVATVPMGIQVAVSSSLITASINAWFGAQWDRAIDDSAEVASAYYDAWRNISLHYGRQISTEITERRLLRADDAEQLASFVRAKQAEYGLGAVQIFPFGEQAPIATLPDPTGTADALATRDSALVASAFEGDEGTLVDETGGDAGDVIRAAVPIRSSDPERTAEVVGVVVVNHLVPQALAYKVDSIRAAVAEYRNVKPLAAHVGGVFRLALVIISLATVLFALWWGLRMAKGVTGPIRALAEGTAKVARGELDVVVAEASDDEIGFLVRSFNRMTSDLREALARLEHGRAELDQRRRTMEIVLRNVDAGVVSIDAEGHISTINRAAQRLFGVAEVPPPIGRKLAEAAPRRELLATVQELIAQARPGSRESVRRQTLSAAGDEPQTLLVTVSRMQDEDGRALGSVVVVDDYTQEVRAQRTAAWREVARRIAHEIKNPLTPIQLSAERIRRRFRERLAANPEDARVFDECVDTITSHVEGMKVLVNEFSQFARLPSANPQPGDLDSLVQEAVASYTGAPGVRFATDCAGDLPRVDFDREQLRRVLTNLIDNACAAVQANGGAGEVMVATRHDAARETVRLEVADDGAGIRDEDRARVFEPYYSTKPHGTGLGLAIVARIVADHHGYVRAQRNTPRGSRFVVELPVRYA